MRAMILAAGYGTRLRPLTDDIPKPIIPVANIPLLKHNLLLLKKYGIKEVIINVHYLSKLITDHFKDGSDLGMNIFYSYEPEILGSAGGIKQVENFFQNKTFMVINSDILIDINLRDVIKYHNKNKALATMVLRENRELEKYGTIEIDSQGIIRQFLGKLRWDGEPLRKLMFTGIHVLQPEFLVYINPHVFLSINEHIYPEMISKGWAIYGYVNETGYWKDIGTLKRYLEAHKDILDKKITLGQTIPEVEPGIWIEENTHIDPTARLIKPVMIGANSSIGANSVIGPYVVIGKDCRFDQDVKTKNSIFWGNVIVKRNVTMYNAIVGYNTLIEKGVDLSEKLMAFRSGSIISVKQ